ncbi:uncharacterized protein LOC134229889 [Saccostrea cucullata]|uniref:uncharacterized protein LOC134229889 n=1 Tax=Saccostrea cuccullata TaxID=36930 RepID=UPI002ED4A10E
MQEKVYFDSCNKTGSWKIFDSHIKRSCESRYINNDKMYKNMFCKICNPPIYTENVIGRCNVTGMYDDYNPTQERACLNNDANQGSLPYKNVFCLSCNKPSQFNSNFLDVSAEIKTKIDDIKDTGRTTTFYSDINIFSMHPVTDPSTDIPYLNMYCLLCKQSSSTKVARHKPWDIKANCSVYIDKTNFLLFSDFLKALRAAGCDTYYHPPRSVTSCQNSKTLEQPVMVNVRKHRTFTQ